MFFFNTLISSEPLRAADAFVLLIVVVQRDDKSYCCMGTEKHFLSIFS